MIFGHPLSEVLASKEGRRDRGITLREPGDHDARSSHTPRLCYALTVSILEAIAAQPVRPLRRNEYDQLVESGAFVGERLELIEGRLVRGTPQGLTLPGSSGHAMFEPRRPGCAAFTGR